MSSKILAQHRLPDGSFVPLPSSLGAVPSAAPSTTKTNGTPVARTTSKDNARNKRSKLGNPPQPQAAPTPVITTAGEPITLKPRNAAQRLYFKSIVGSDVPFVLGVGPAGTGKTHGPVIHAINELRAGRITKIIITRPMVGAGGEDLGTLPGGIVEKVAPWCIPILDIIKEHYSPQQVAKMMELEIIEIAPLALMRGRTLKNAIVIVDESQNCSVEQMKMMLTRIGPNCRMMITGDVEQHDDLGKRSGLADLMERLDRRPISAFDVHEFAPHDCVRHEAIEDVLGLFAA